MPDSAILTLFAQANDFKEGDLLVGGTRDETIRKIAREQIAALTIRQISRSVFVEDRMTEVLRKSLDQDGLRETGHLRIGELKKILLSEKGPAWVRNYATALPSEAIAAVVKILDDGELSRVALGIHNTHYTKTPKDVVVIGSRLHFGSRIQPNSPGDEPDEILLSILEGLCYGCGDVIIGINPASDDLDTIVSLENLLHTVVSRLKLPTRYCVLSDMYKQKAASAHSKVDVGFQSLAGTSKCLEGMLGCEVDDLLELCRHFNGLYFETGQGSELTNGSAQGVDMVTLEARCYGLARHLRKETGKWTILNDVAGFIGPEVFTTGRQLRRACLEDTVMAKIHGLVMGLDVCSTFHMGIHPAELKNLTGEIVTQASPAYIMGVAGNADPMLGYLTTSYRNHPLIRQKTGRHITTSFQSRLISLGALREDGSADATPERIAALHALFHRLGGDQRNEEVLVKEAKKKIRKYQDRGCDLGHGADPQGQDPPFVTMRLDTLYAHARKALYALVESSVIDDCCEQPVCVTTLSTDRDDFLAHPVSGEQIREADVMELIKTVTNLHYKSSVQFVISDGLNANSVNEHLRRVLPAVKQTLRSAGVAVSPHDIVVSNGRVRAGYHIGQILGSELIVHLIGERPGTGLNQLSAYITYGRDRLGTPAFSPGMDHSLTTAVCGIHPNGKSYKMAVDEIVKIILNGLELKMTGVKLGTMII